MSKVANISEARRKRDMQALRIATAVCRTEQRIHDHEQALIAINRFYSWPPTDGDIA